ncbi:asparaginase-domain-containing protein [Paraphysoderma sedebokerense]|nr:asparaginase-domain-containing protein [Paraphysoderma sedebokerense]
MSLNPSSNRPPPLRRSTSNQILDPSLASPIFKSDTVNLQISTIRPNELVSQDVTRVLIIYTGGTIGMKNTAEHGYIPIPNYLSQVLESMTRFHDPFFNSSESSSSTPDQSSRSCNTLPTHPSVAASPNVLQPELYDSVSYHESFASSSQLISAQAQDEEKVKRSEPTIRVSKKTVKSLITPPSLYGKRIRYVVLEYEPLLDSANMSMSDWVKIATDIELNYQYYDAFLVLHGTDTMSYTASALSFMLENLGKTVILTGSQVPLAEVRNDAVENLLGALTIAGHFVIPEVTLYFNNKLYRGNRTSKTDAIDFHAFDSPNLRPLVNMGVNIDVSWSDIWIPKAIAKFRAHKVMNQNVATLRIFPGITLSTVRAFLAAPIQGVVLETYGAGNAPHSRKDIIDALKEASDRGVVVVNVSQCKRGVVTDLYATGKALVQIGIVPGYDMTPESALTKLSYLLGKNLSPTEIRNQMRKSLRGELVVPEVKMRFNSFVPLQEGGSDVWKVLGEWCVSQETGKNSTNSEEEVGNENEETKEHFTYEELTMIKKSLFPILACVSAQHGDVDGLEILKDGYKFDDASKSVANSPEKSAGSIDKEEKERNKQLVREQDQGREQGDGLRLNCTDYIGWTPLHHAASSGHLSTVHYLLRNGASVHIRDKYNHTPLWYAVKHKYRNVTELLVEAGAHWGHEEREAVGKEVIEATIAHDITHLSLLTLTNSPLLPYNIEHRNPLHLSCILGSLDLLEFWVNLIHGKFSTHPAPQIIKTDDANTEEELVSQQDEINVIDIYGFGVLDYFKKFVESRVNVVEETRDSGNQMDVRKRIEKLKLKLKEIGFR